MKTRKISFLLDGVVTLILFFPSRFIASNIMYAPRMFCATIALINGVHPWLSLSHSYKINQKRPTFNTSHLQKKWSLCKLLIRQTCFT